jgi:hypothetical protein
MLSREERWWLFRSKHEANKWAIPWDRMAYPSHEFFNKYVKVYSTDIDIFIPDTIDKCNEEELKIIAILRLYKKL